MNVKYIIYNSSGEILRTGDAPESELQNQIQPGEFIILGTADVEKDTIDVNTQQVVVGGKPPPPINMDYRLARSNAYPPVEAQMDMLWHAMDKNELPRIEPFYSYIKAVKEAYPPDNSVVPGSVVVQNYSE